ncbi:hypothetical protein [Sulfurimonas paralvinellae]|uniref:Uncharacterized protein n=1 Tax=Sulfurimonas paralvinellae TaxID=317658 RepID=A0A7M1B5V6_9BACT|nr:hypothetical protein [Sulfurimonas paralvinellae]QOP45119.1 hypothetical protein FM071_01935 [Sulfurimonas paralvinellae]
MKQLITISQLIITAFLLNSCASSTTKVAPSQNSALNSISKSNAAIEKEGAMQKSLDSWLHDDWEPTIAKDKEIQKKYMKEEKGIESNTSATKTQESHFVDKEDKNFTLQEYVDKAAAYMRAKPNDYNSSNVHKLESMPVIGK